MIFNSSKNKIRQLYNNSIIEYDKAQNAFQTQLLVSSRKHRLEIPIHSWKSQFLYQSDWEIIHDWGYQWTLDFDRLPLKFLSFVNYSIITKHENLDKFIIHTSKFNLIQDTDIENIKRVRMIFGMVVHPRLTWFYNGRGGTPIDNMESLLGEYPEYTADEFTGQIATTTEFQSKLIVSIINPEVQE